MTDKLGHFQMWNGHFRCAIAITTDAVIEAQNRLDLGPMAAIAFGRALSCTALLASKFKQPTEYVSCTFEGNGPLGKLITECNGSGHLRGQIEHPRLAEVLDPNKDSIPQNIQQAIGGEGTLFVTYGRPGEMPHNSFTELENGEIATDITKFLFESEQTPSSVAAGVKLDKDGKVIAAGAALVQKLGGANIEPEEITKLEDVMTNQLNISDMIYDGKNLGDLFEVISGEKAKSGLLLERPLSYHCPCHRDRFYQSLRQVNTEELIEIEQQTGKLEVRCPYCHETYHFSSKDFLDS